MSLFSIAVGKSGLGARTKHRKTGFDRNNIESQVKSRLLTSYFAAMPADEAMKFGRSLMSRLLGDTVDPEAALKADLFENDAEFKSEYRDLLLEEKRLKNESMRRKNGKDADDERYDPFTEYAREIALEALEKGRRSTGMGESLINSLGQLVPALMAMNQNQNGQQLPITVQTPEQFAQQQQRSGIAQPADQQSSEAPMAKPRLLMEVFSAPDIQQLLAIKDSQEAGRVAASKIQEVLQTMPDHKQAAAIMGIEAALRAPVSFLLMYLGGYKDDPAWNPIVRYLEQHQQHLAKLQAAIEAAMGEADAADPDAGDDIPDEEPDVVAAG